MPLTEILSVKTIQLLIATGRKHKFVRDNIGDIRCFDIQDPNNEGYGSCPLRALYFDVHPTQPDDRRHVLNGMFVSPSSNGRLYKQLPILQQEIYDIVDMADHIDHPHRKDFERILGMR